MIFVNFKTYQQGTGSQALDLIKKVEEVATESQVKIIPVVQASDIKEATQSSRLEIWVQRIDPYEEGAHTGAIIAEAVYEDGALGTFLNHSENKFGSFEELTLALDRAKNVGLKTLIFASSLDELSKAAGLKPTFAAYEPPEFIGNKEISVASATPEIIASAAKICKSEGVPLIVGAGIHSREDVKKSLELGAVGIAVSSYVVDSEDPVVSLRELLGGYGG